MTEDRSRNPRVRRGDRILVTNWGNDRMQNSYSGLVGTVRCVSNQNVVTVDLDNDPMQSHPAYKRIGLIFDPRFRYDTFEIIGRRGDDNAD